MKPLVSVIVPVYKVEKYLTRCLDSLCRQSLNNIEILLIDDASPDQCGKICEQYAAKDTRFKVFHHVENSGLSGARNTGIQEATADYLMFVDSDDWVHEDFCKVPYEYAIQNKVDLMIFSFLCTNTAHHKTVLKPEKTVTNGIKTREETIELLLEGTISNVAWNKFYHKKLFKNISYPFGCFYEDVGTSYKLIKQATCIYYLDKKLYYYSQRAGSISTLKTKKAICDRTKMYLQQYYDLIAWGYSPKKVEEHLLNISMFYCIRKKPDASDLLYNVCKNTLHKPKTIPAHFQWKQKVLFVLFNYFPTIFELTCEIWGKKVF